jgi:OOP family OmpA-OmpF porin
MKKTMQLTTLASLIFLSVVAQPSLAVDAGKFYLGADVGSTEFKGDGPGKNSVFVAGQEFTDSDSSYGIHAGFQFNDWFAAELGYTDFGRASQRFIVRPDILFIVAPNHTQIVDAKGASLAGVFSYQLGQGFSVLGVLGVSSVKYESTWTGGFSEVTGNLRERQKVSDQGLIYGIGGRYELNDSLALRLELRCTDVGDFDLDTANFGLEYSF